jgi:hypothetical protein
VLHQHPQILDRRHLDHPFAHVRQDLGDPFPGDTPLAADLRPVLAVLSHKRLDPGGDDSKARVVVVLNDRLGASVSAHRLQSLRPWRLPSSGSRCFRKGSRNAGTNLDDGIGEVDRTQRIAVLVSDKKMFTREALLQLEPVPTLLHQPLEARAPLPPSMRAAVPVSGT